MVRELDKYIDRTRLFTMIYSGVENEEYFKTLYDLGIRDFLMSYHYIQNKSLDVQKYLDLGVKFFIDSGAYTYQLNEEFASYTVEQWEQQVIEYLDWCRNHKDMIFAIANLDLEGLVGEEAVLEWNKKYFEPFMLETGIPVCFIWHTFIGEKAFEKYCERYPYVGFSWASDNSDLDFNYGQRLLRIAEKYNTVVHGMGMTRTALLPKLPFFTSDSTTWLVGLQYGEVNYWRGKKMSRLKKDQWKGEYLPKILNKYPFLDKDKLVAEDNIELIKVNVMAFIDANKYIQEKLKNRMYWLKPVANTCDRDNFDMDNFPNLIELSEGNYYDDYLNYCTALNIGTEDEKLAFENLLDCTAFCNWDLEEYQDIIQDIYDKETIEHLHDKWVNKITPNLEDKILELTNFYWECVEGKRTELLYEGTNFQLKAKEREYYIEEEEYDLEDMSLSEIKEKVSDLLPPPTEGHAPEIDELDNEIFDMSGIVAVRDEKGRFIKGQKKVRKPKNIYSEKYPKLACDTCYAFQTCPEAKSGYVCAFNKMFKRFDTRDENDIVEAMQSMINLNMERMQRIAVFEMLDGGMVDNNLTNMIDQNMRLLTNLKSLYECGGNVLKHTKTVKADGTVEETTQVTNKGQGILEKMFSMDKKSETSDKKDKETINVDCEVK